MRLGEAECLARALIKQYNPGITFAWSRTKNALGDYSWGRKRLRLSQILVPQLPIEQVTITIKHELAHSLAPPNSGHGPEWQRIMINTFNLPPKRCSDADLDLTLIKGGWRGTCPNGHVSTTVYMRRPTKVRSCYQCSPLYDPRFILTYVKS